MAEIDRIALLRDLDRAIARTSAFLASRRRDPASASDVDPYAATRWVSTRSTLLTLLERPDPATPYAASWVCTFLLGRVNLDAEAAEQVARSVPSVELEDPPSRISIRAAVQRLVAEREPAVRRHLAEAIVRASGESAAFARELWSRRGETLARAGVEASLLSPIEPPSALADVASRVLARTDDLAASVLGRPASFDEAIAAGAAQDDDVPWPAQLAARTVIEPFRGEARWLDVPDLDLGAMPRALAGSSFTRAFARFGARWADAARSRETPRALAQLPSGIERLATGALVGSLVGNETFLRRALGFSRAEAERTSRSQARVVLLAWRLAAARVLVRAPALAGDRRAAEEAFVEHVARALRIAPPRELALVLPRLSLADPARLLAFGEGVVRANALRDRFDEDWFRNPAAVVALRDRLGRSPPLHVAAEDAYVAIDAVATALSSRLG